jgi:hypothetical protein
MAEVTPDSGSEDDAVYRAAGLALEHAQYFEAEVVNIVFMHGLARRKVLSRAQAEKLIEGSEKAPLRRLLKEVLARVRTEPDLTATFFEAVDRRNWLVHRLFWDLADDFKTSAGRSKILAELREITGLLHSAHVFAQLISELYLKQTGVDPDELYERVRDS